MMHREDDAKTKVCPIMQAGSQQHETCVASDCMMWERGPDITETFAIAQDLQVPPEPPGDGFFLGIFNNRIAWIRSVGKTGSCGLIQKS